MVISVRFFIRALKWQAEHANTCSAFGVFKEGYGIVLHPHGGVAGPRIAPYYSPIGSCFIWSKGCFPSCTSPTEWEGRWSGQEQSVLG